MAARETLDAMLRMIEAMRDVSARPIQTAMETSRELMRDPRASPTGAHRDGRFYSTDRVAQTSHRIDAVEFRAGRAASRACVVGDVVRRFPKIRNAFGGSINDVVLTILSEAASRYLQHHGYAANGQLCIGCPVNVRHKEEAIVARQSGIDDVSDAACEPMDVVERLRYVLAKPKKLKCAVAASTRAADVDGR